MAPSLPPSHNELKKGQKILSSKLPEQKKWREVRKETKCRGVKGSVRTCGTFNDVIRPTGT